MKIKINSAQNLPWPCSPVLGFSQDQAKLILEKPTQTLQDLSNYKTVDDTLASHYYVELRNLRLEKFA